MNIYHIFPIFFLGVSFFSSTHSHAYYGSNSYSNYYSTSKKLTKEERQDKIATVLTKIYDEIKQSLSTCRSRQTCEEATLKIINRAKTSLNSDHPARTVLEDILQDVKEEADKTNFTSQLAVFGHLSQKGQNEFQAGVRIKPLETAIRKLKASNLKDNSYHSRNEQAPPLFDKDDVLIYLIQQIDESHRSCRGFSKCLNADISIAKKLEGSLDKDDPARYEVKSVLEDIEDNAQQQIFDPIPILEKYRARNEGLTAPPLVSDSSTYELKWNEIRRTSQAKQWRDPMIVNLADYQKGQKKKKSKMEEKFKTAGEGAVNNLLGGLLKNFGF